MKSALFGFLAMACLLSACSKNDNGDDAPPAPEKEWLLDHMLREEDSVKFIYNTDGTVKQFDRYSTAGGWDDSTRLEYSGGKISKFLLLNYDGSIRTDRAFTYSGEQLVRIDYYNFISGSEVEITDHDSLVYSEGRLTECHRINGTFRNSFSRYTWENGDMVKEEIFSVINDQPVPDAVITYTYNDKPGPAQSIKGNFVFLFSQGDYTLLSAHAPVKAETTYLPAEEPSLRRTMEHTYDAEALLSKTITTEEDLTANETTVETIRYVFVEKE